MEKEDYWFPCVIDVLPCLLAFFLMGQPVMLIWREGDGAQAQMAVVTGYCLDKIL